MRKYGNIEWRNIYYMLCFAVDEIGYTSHFNAELENIETTVDLLGELLNRSFSIVLSEQLLRQYSREYLDLSSPCGHMNIEKSYQNGAIGRGRINCTVSNFDENNRYNQAIKAGFLSLLHFGNSDEISDAVKFMLVQNLQVLSGIESKYLTLDLIGDDVNVPDWYKPVRVVLLMIYYGYMASDTAGENPLYALEDKDRLCRIFEKFVLNYCAYTYGRNDVLSVSKPTYDIYRQFGSRRCELDLLLEDDRSALIVDMKWYEAFYNRGCAENIRQMKDYMDGYRDRMYGKHYDMACVNGLLLYADSSTTELNYEPYGRDEVSRIYWQTIGLNQEWENILGDLDKIFSKFVSLKVKRV